MPKRTDIHKILVIGSGPIVIGQACEFDYSGTQGVKALKEEGYEIILVNSNPATIMTDPSLADQTYIEPLVPEILEKIIEKERPDALLPTLGGQTALNLAMALHKNGVLAKYNVKMLGANPEVIEKAEDRHLFKEAMLKIGLDMPISGVAYTIEDSKKLATEIGFPCIIRPAFTLGGTGGGIAYNMAEVETIAASGLHYSMISEILIEESIIGWKEYELEVMRDTADNVVVICSIENLDPMGIHTGDSITVAPAQTLTDVEYQKMRDAGLAIIREIGVETGGSNIQFAINPADGRMIVIEMNPRVSRSSALASKATGFPIAKLAAKLAAGYTLDELPNDITLKTPACFEPAIDYVVVKFPRFNFDKFKAATPILGTSMKSVGETMAIGRTFREAFQKGLRSLEIKRSGFGFDGKDPVIEDRAALIKLISTAAPERIFHVKLAFDAGFTDEDIHHYTKIDPWFIYQLRQIHTMGTHLATTNLLDAKRNGFSDAQIAQALQCSETEVREKRYKAGIKPIYKLVDTCAAEFEAQTPYYYSSYDQEDESRPSPEKSVMILGGGPNRIGQGIEFDYCCVHASMALRESGFRSIMVNSNPETVSTDYDISDTLYFEPLTLEDVLHIYENEKPDGVIVQFGGQTPLNLAKQLADNGVTILGTSPDSIDRAEDRDLFGQLITKLNLRQPASGMATNGEEAIAIAERIGYPVLLRPSYVLGGTSMEIVYNNDECTHYMNNAKNVWGNRAVLIDQYLENATEVDVDAVSDGSECVVAGIMEHVEEAGIHSGDSACALPPVSLSREVVNEIREATHKIALELNVIGLLNIQFAVKNGVVYILEVNPRGSRTVPFVSKTTGIQWAKVATKVIVGQSIQSLGIREVTPTHIAVKEAVFPFNKFPGVDILLGPEMKSTGEVMGVDKTFGMAFLKSQLAAGQKLPKSGRVFISLKDTDKSPEMVATARLLQTLHFEIVCTDGTRRYFESNGITCSATQKVLEGRPNIVDEIKNSQIQMVINTPSGKYPLEDEIVIRQSALMHQVPVITTIAGAIATVNALKVYLTETIEISSLQDLYKQSSKNPT